MVDPSRGMAWRELVGHVPGSSSGNRVSWESLGSFALDDADLVVVVELSEIQAHQDEAEWQIRGAADTLGVAQHMRPGIYDLLAGSGQVRLVRRDDVREGAIPRLWRWGSDGAAPEGTRVVGEVSPESGIAVIGPAGSLSELSAGVVLSAVSELGEDAGSWGVRDSFLLARVNSPVVVVLSEGNDELGVLLEAEGEWDSDVEREAREELEDPEDTEGIDWV